MLGTIWDSCTKLTMSSFITYTCVLFFGLGAWLSINSVYTQLPLLVDVLPEQWGFATLMVCVLQAVCLLSIIYAYFASKSKHLKQGNIPATIVLCAMNIGALLLSAFVYKQTVVIGGTEHSLYFLISIAIMSLPCTMSDVIFLPFISRFKSNNLVITFFLGMGLSALIPALGTFIQGTEGVSNVTLPVVFANGTSGFEEYQLKTHPLFDVKQFLVGISIIASIPLFAFLVLIRQLKTDKRLQDDTVAWPHPGINTKYIDDSLSRPRWFAYLILVACVGGIQNSIIPSIIPYATNHLGPDAYHLANTLYIIVNPLFCFFPFLLRIRKFRYHGAIFSVTILCVATIFMYACIPEIAKTDAWYINPIIYLAISTLSGFLSWQRAAIGETLRRANEKSGLFFCGTFIQIGSCTGAAIMILLTNVFKVFD
uniref:Riboflavin transporter n=1 Tax=Rhabditophanes sp. KR3021 TaxID=114890 RepID=A0AC35TZP0_9BILA